MTPPIKAGDKLYAVGVGHHARHGADDLQLYSATVFRVRQEKNVGSEGPKTVEVLDLAGDRPVLGFAKWCYNAYDVGVSVHRTPEDALAAFAEHAGRRHAEAERAAAFAEREVRWADEKLAAIKAGRAP